jgi:hypothetical protein
MSEKVRKPLTHIFSLTVERVWDCAIAGDDAGSGGRPWPGGDHVMGDAESGRVRLSFTPRLCVEFRGTTVTSDGGCCCRWTSSSALAR